MTRKQKPSRSPVGLIGACAAAVFVLSGFAAFADDPNYTPPRVDDSYPHHQPPYPESAQLSGEQGTVVLNVYVGSSGRIRDIRVLTSSGYDDLDTAAVEGVYGWHFVPAIRYGDTESEWAAVKIVFQLPTAAPVVKAPTTAPAH